MNRRTLDMTLSGLYVVAILIAVFAFDGKGVGAVAAIGAVLIGIYWGGLRRNIKA